MRSAGAGGEKENEDKPENRREEDVDAKQKDRCVERRRLREPRVREHEHGGGFPNAELADREWRNDGLHKEDRS